MRRQRLPVGRLLDYEAAVNPNGPPTIIVRLINDDVEYSRGEDGTIWRRILRSRGGPPIPLVKLQVVPVYDFRWVPPSWQYPLVVPYTRRDFWSPLEIHGGAVQLEADGRVLEVPESAAGGGIGTPVVIGELVQVQEPALGSVGLAASLVAVFGIAVAIFAGIGIWSAGTGGNKP